MIIQAIQNARDPVCRRAQRMQDVLLVSSFGLWAALLGLVPGVALRLLLAS
jgi:hypothetical protein